MKPKVRRKKRKRKKINKVLDIVLGPFRKKDTLDSLYNQFPTFHLREKSLSMLDIGASYNTDILLSLSCNSVYGLK